MRTLNDKLYKRLSGYGLIIFDMDGTLYFQKGMQIRMALALIGCALTGRHGFRDLRLILKYRKLRETWDSEREVDDEEIYKELSGMTGMDSSGIGDIISLWMFDRPLDIVRRCRDRDLIEVIKRLKHEGKKVCVYSDYPTEDKCRAVGLGDDIPQFYPGQEKGGISTLKPNPAGLIYIMNRYPDIAPEDTVMIGDRYEKDAAAAEGAGIDSIILKRFKLQRLLKV